MAIMLMVMMMKMIMITIIPMIIYENDDDGDVQLIYWRGRLVGDNCFEYKFSHRYFFIKHFSFKPRSQKETPLLMMTIV